jgi:hypothetical protein
MRNRLGLVLRQEFLAAPDGTLLCFVAPNETLFEDHVAMLAGTLHSRQDLDYAWTKAIIHGTDGLGDSHLAVEHSLDLLSGDPAAPVGLARFMFRAGAFATQLDYLLESLDIRAASGLAFYATGASTKRASLIVDIRGKCHLGIRTDPAAERKLGAEVWQDLEAIRDLDAPRFDADQRENQIRAHMQQLDARNQASGDILHKAFHNLHTAFEAIRDGQKRLVPDALYLDHLSRANLRGILMRLLGSLPMPGALRRLVVACMRAVRRVARKLRGRG